MPQPCPLPSLSLPACRPRPGFANGRRFLATALLTGLLGIVALFACPLPASAAEAERPASQALPFFKRFYGDWTVSCRALSGLAVSCSLTTGTQTEDLAGALSVDSQLEGAAVVAAALDRGGFAPDTPVSLRIDKLEPLSLEPRGKTLALFEGEAGATLVSQMQAGQKASLTFTLEGEKKKQTLVFSLHGFTDALDAFRAQMLLFENFQNQTNRGE